VHDRCCARVHGSESRRCRLTPNHQIPRQVSFLALETRLDQGVLYERQITQHQPEIRNLEYIIKVLCVSM